MLKYGGVSGDEAEVIFRLDKTDGKVHVNSCWPDCSRKLERMFGPPPKYSETKEGLVTSAFWVLTPDSLHVRKGKRKDTRTPEQRRALGERLRKTRLGG